MPNRKTGGKRRSKSKKAARSGRATSRRITRKAGSKTARASRAGRRTRRSAASRSRSGQIGF